MPWGRAIVNLELNSLPVPQSATSNEPSAMLVWATKKPAEPRAKWERNRIGKLSGPVSARRNGRQAEEMVRGTG
jgi:hypothetical protein